MPVTFTGPLPPGPLGFCVVCAASWKAAALRAQKPAITAAERSPGELPATVALAPPGMPPPARAVGWTLVTLPAPPGGPGAGNPVAVPAPACWSHLQAVEFSASGIIPAPPGAVLLDGSGPRPPP